jgi:hypothetical protein
VTPAPDAATLIPLVNFAPFEKAYSRVSPASTVTALRKLIGVPALSETVTVNEPALVFDICSVSMQVVAAATAVEDVGIACNATVKAVVPQLV